MKGNIVFIDSTYNYPHNFTAANTKIDLLAQGLNQFENDCIIINSILGDPKIKKLLFYIIILLNMPFFHQRKNQYLTTFSFYINY